MGRCVVGEPSVEVCDRAETSDARTQNRLLFTTLLLTLARFLKGLVAKEDERSGYPKQRKQQIYTEKQKNKKPNNKTISLYLYWLLLLLWRVVKPFLYTRDCAKNVRWSLHVRSVF